ncbi:MAG: hypothetical protein F6K16_26435 [Symploca sp. SIO2B6]|nr:hypothetical protein [Symploca sp. SIO2B6]
MGRWGDGEMGRWGDGEMGRRLLTSYFQVNWIIYFLEFPNFPLSPSFPLLLSVETLLR